MIRAFGWSVVGAAAVAMSLTACLVEHKKVEFYEIQLPAKWPTFSDGHYVDFLYDIYLANGTSQNTSGSIKWLWESSYQLAPFTGDTVTPILRFSVAERLGDGEKKSIQYITQDSTGSMFLHATEGIGATVTTVRQNSYWANNDPTLNSPTAPAPLQLLWSPIDSGSTNIIGEDKSTGTTYLVGPCDAASCPTAATITISELRINRSEPSGIAIEEVETPIGKFEAYRLDYAGEFNINASLPVIPFFDYRMSCWTPGETGTVSFNGSIWIYPSIGPVQIENACRFGSDSTYYSARVSKTNLAY